MKSIFDMEKSNNILGFDPEFAATASNESEIINNWLIFYSE